MSKQDCGSLSASPGDNAKTPVETPDQLLELLGANPEMILEEVAMAIDKSLRATERTCAKLVKEGRLRFVGPRKGGHWEVLQ